jgi:hypothetical protein
MALLSRVSWVPITYHKPLASCMSIGGAEIRQGIAADLYRGIALSLFGPFEPF